MSKKQLSSKLKSYSAMAGAVLAATGTAEAQIVYTDIDPDQQVDSATTSVFFIDLDNNGTNDFGFSGYDYQGINVAYMQLAPMTGNATMSDLYTTPYGAVPTPTGLAAGTLIDATATNWADSTAYSGATQYLGVVGGPFITGTVGDIPGTGDKYIGLRFESGTNVHYGWARVNVTATAGVVTIKDYAYNAVPNGGINAGDITNGVIHVLQPNAWEVRNDNNNLLVSTELENATIYIYNASGQLITTGAANKGATNFDLSNQAAGVYLVNISQGNTRGTKKVILF